VPRGRAGLTENINGQDIREILRLVHNAILVSNIQPTAWNANRTILIPKQGKNLSRVQNYTPITISSLICRTYWGIVDTKLREVIFFSQLGRKALYMRLAALTTSTF
jgi:hypothetical protein